jgi:hypothetical protein
LKKGEGRQEDIGLLMKIQSIKVEKQKGKTEGRNQRDNKKYRKVFVV